MKTILITGTYNTLKSGNVMYNVNVWGQTTLQPNITLITWTSQSMSGYNELIDWARLKFCKYFNTDDFNIIHIDHLTPLNPANQ